MAPLQIGVMFENVQMTDITCVDIIGGMSTEYLKEMASFGIDVTHLGTDMVFHYISSSMEPAFMTPSVRALPTTTYDEAPRNFDILLIGGPPLHSRPPAAEKFMKEAALSTKVIMTTCVGSLWLASSGVLDGKKATTNREAIPLAKSLYPNVEWIDERWVVDGKYWTSGGAGAGIDMVATYAKENFAAQIVGMTLASLDFDPDARGKYYK